MRHLMNKHRDLRAVINWYWYQTHQCQSIDIGQGADNYAMLIHPKGNHNETTRVKQIHEVTIRLQ